MHTEEHWKLHTHVFSDGTGKRNDVFARILPTRACFALRGQVSSESVRKLPWGFPTQGRCEAVVESRGGYREHAAACGELVWSGCAMVVRPHALVETA